MSGLGYYDEQKIETIVRKYTKTQFDDAAKRDRAMIEAMGGVAAALKELTTEIKALRADLGPQKLEKPAKLAAPKTQKA
ncbi:MAG: hypothetical protein IT560_03030 [Alphaproteobacteria bacterium]|nr:hypothetical protein [Alphaproteobacteria bacterium]